MATKLLIGRIRIWYCATALVVLLLGRLSGSIDAAEPQLSEPPASQSLTDLNADFRAAYSRARTELLRRSGPVILFDGEKPILLRDDKRKEGTAVGPAYHHLKAVAHLPLTVFVELVNEPEGALGVEARGRLRSLRERTSAVERELDEIDFAGADRARQRRLVTTSARFLDGVLDRGTFDQAALRQFAAGARPDIEQNIDAAAALELRHYQSQIEAWRKDLSDDEWRRLHVVVIGSQMPRRDNRVVQLFAALLGVPGEGPRIVYAEGLYEEQRALNLLGTHLLDDRAATAFFNDPTRLQRDLLADGAAKYIRENFPKAP